MFFRGNLLRVPEHVKMGRASGLIGSRRRPRADNRIADYGSECNVLIYHDLTIEDGIFGDGTELDRRIAHFKWKERI